MDYPEKQGCCFWKEVVFFRLPELFLKKRIEKVSFLFHLTRTELNKNPNYLVYRVSNRTTLSDTDPGIVPIWATSASFVCVNKATLASGSDIGMEMREMSLSVSTASKQFGFSLLILLHSG